MSSYNYSGYIVEAVNSVLAQSHVPVAIVIVDDGSSDDSVEVLREHYSDNKNIQIVEKNNGGQLSAWVAGLSVLPACDVVALMDSDDIWNENYLSRIANTYVENPSANFVYTNMEYIGDRSGAFCNRLDDRDLGLSVLMGAFVQRWQGTATSAITLKRSLMEKLLDLPEEFIAEWRSRPDDCLVFGGEILGAHKIYLGDCLVKHRSHGKNALLSYRKTRMDKCQYVMRSERMLGYYREKAGVNERWCRLAKHEFRTKPLPQFSEFLCYLRLNWAAPMSLIKRLEYSLAICAHFLTSRRQ